MILASVRRDDPQVDEQTLLLLGPTYAGVLAAFLLFGISVMQLYTYSSRYKDNIYIKVTVYGIFLLDILQSIIIAALGYYSLVTGWGRPSALGKLNWAFTSIPIVTGIIAAWVQGFYAWRIWVLSQWRVLPIFIILVALMQCCAAISITAASATLEDVSRLHTLYRRTICWLGGAAGADIIIAVCMLYFLFTIRRNKLHGTQLMINRLIRLTVETGVITAACAILELIMFQALSTTNLHLFFACALAKIYSNALMTSLNSRRATSSPSSRHDQESSAGYSSTSFSKLTSRGGRSFISGIGSRPGGGGGGGGVGGVGGGQDETLAGSTVVHISTATEREVDFAGVEEDLKSGEEAYTAKTQTHQTWTQTLTLWLPYPITGQAIDSV
ncbi:hypothetical protein BDY19DRAFT_907457 [Irpex rosettiformis]|uniref:Uncharacterized protein n=1 Tax=Irpex rosettiformis TaxID=378272 RepID=A0ACB8U0N1_9APHY|nr:hypothetical protein BDY19DRAFT_907457 [Irpex rosettiformis]